MCHDLINIICNLIILYHMNYKIGANCPLTLAPHLQKAQSKSMFTAFTFLFPSLFVESAFVGVLCKSLRRDLRKLQSVINNVLKVSFSRIICTYL